MSKVRCRWGYALQCPLCTKLLGWCGWVRKIKSPLAPLSLAPLRSLAEASGAADPLQPKSHTLWKTRSSCNTFSRTPLPATTLATSDVAPVTLVPSVVRTLRLSLLHSHYRGWLHLSLPSAPCPLQGPVRTSNLKRALRRGILWCSQASPPTGALSDHITVQDERRTAPPFTVRGRPTAPVSASAADPGGSRPRYDAGGATPCSVLRAQNSKTLGWCGWVRKIKSRLAPLSLAPLRSLAEVSGAADPLQPKSLTPWKTRSPCNSFSCTALPATTLATSVVAPVTVVPSVVRTLRLSLLHSH